MSGIAQDKIYVHTATAANSVGNLTYINHPNLNGNPNAGIVYVHAWNPNNLPAVYNNNVTGLYYSSVESKWAIYNEDQSPIVDGSHYMVYIASEPNDVITHVSNAGNHGGAGDFTTLIDDPRMNFTNPGPYAVMCHYYNTNSIYNPGKFSFYYDTSYDKRGFFDDNGVPIPDGAAFKVLISGQGATRFTHITTAGNINGNTTRIDDPALNGNPNATFVFAHYYDRNGSTANQVKSVTSVFYDGNFWQIYCEDTSYNMPEDVAFDIIVVPQDTTAGVEDNQLAANISMFPNPAKKIVNFKASKSIENVTIYNMLGQKIMDMDNNATAAKMDISPLAQGTYLAKVKAGQGTQTLKLIKE
jgi:hypothetical protein